MKVFYTDTFPIPLPKKHNFPKDKYHLLRKRISEKLGHQMIDLQIPAPASRRAIDRAHSAGYVDRLFAGGLTDAEIRRVGLPWSPQIVKRTRYSAGATIAACRAALTEAVAVNLAGGKGTVIDRIGSVPPALRGRVKHLRIPCGFSIPVLKQDAVRLRVENGIQARVSV